MMACLDTSALIDLRRGRRNPRRLRARAAIEALVRSGERLTTTIVNVAELQVGIHRAPDRGRERIAVERLLHDVLVLPLDDAAAELYGRVMARRLDTGTSPGDVDVLIAAIAMAHGERLVTRNAAHFSRIRELDVVEY